MEPMDRVNFVKIPVRDDGEDCVSELLSIGEACVVEFLWITLPSLIGIATVGSVLSCLFSLMVVMIFDAALVSVTTSLDFDLMLAAFLIFLLAVAAVLSSVDLGAVCLIRFGAGD